MDNRPGKSTSEYYLAKVALGLGAMMAVLAVLPQHVAWVQIAMAVGGALVAILGTLGYQVPRAGVKREQIRTSASARGLSLTGGKPPDAISGQ